MQERELETSFQLFRDQADVRALAAVFDAVAPELLAIARHLAPQRGDAEDLVQATFLTAIEKAHAFDGTRRLVPWMLGMLTLHAHEARARRGRAPEPGRLAVSTSAAPESEASARELESAVARAVSALPETYAPLVRRHLIDGARPGELALEFDLSPGNARVRLHRGMKLLRGSLPQGFASVGVGWWLARRGLQRVRGEVLRRASAVTGATAPSVLAPVTWAALVACAALVSGATWLKLARPSPKANGAGVALSAAHVGSDAPRVEIASTGDFDSRSSADVRATVATATPTRPNSESQPKVAIHGRILLPSGAPALGARMRCAPAADNTLAWLAPEPLSVSSDGSFEFAFDAPPKLALRVTAVLEHCATIGWRWNDIGASAPIELGDVTFERAGTLSVAVVDEHGASLCDGWRISLFDASEARSHGQEMIFRDLDCAGAGTVVFDDLAARHYSVRAVHGFAAETAWNTADVVADRASRIELVYRGPDPERRIGVAVSFAAACRNSELAAEHVHLVARDGARITATAIANQPNRFVFDGVAGDGYEVSVDDERCLPWRRAGVAAGESVAVDLVGAASIELRVLDRAGRDAASYSLSAIRIESGRSSASSPVLELGDAPPADGVFRGFLPGDVDLQVGLDGAPARTVRVERLRAGEARAVDVSFATGIALTGRVLASDGRTPCVGVSVELTRAPGADSTAARGMVVSIDAGGPRAEQSVVTGTDGSFRFDALEPGDWRARARWNELVSAERTVRLADVAPAPIELIQPACGWIDGAVEHFVPVDGTRLVVHANPISDDADSVALEVDARDDGTFHLGPLPVGPTRVVALTRPERGAGWGRAGRAITTFTHYANELDTYAVVADRATAVRLDGRELAPGRIRVRVTIDGGSSQGTSVYARSCDVEQRQRAVEFELRADVDEKGFCALDGLRAGDYSISLHTADGAWAWQRDDAVPIAAGDNPELEVRVQLVRRVVRVVDAAQRPLAKQVLEWRTGAGSCVTHGTTRENGELELTLPAGQVHFECPGHALANADVDWSSGVEPVVLRVTQRE